MGVMYRIGKDKMNMLIVPYDGESAELTLALKRYNVDVPKKECKNGTCPIPKPLKMMSASEVKNRILKIGATNVKQIVVLALNEKDQNILVEMSRVGDWGNVKKGVTVKIISVV